MAGINFDVAEVAAPCGHCGKEIATTIGRLKRDKKLVCPDCDQVTEVDTRPFEAEARRLNEQIRKMGFK